MRFKLVFSIVSFMTIICGIAMAVPGLIDVWDKQINSAYRLFLAAAATVFIGVLGLNIFKSPREPLRPKEMFLTTSLVWLSFSFFAALPFYFSSYNVSVTDAFFESVSGLTTTGATIFTGLDNMNRGLLFWRSLTQWLGGVGIVIVVMTVLPTLHVGGMHFFETETSEATGKTAPKLARTLQAILYFFLFLTVVCTGCLWAAGMTPFDAINHAMTTIATGGFSTKDASIAFFENPVIEWIIITFMIISGLPLIIGLLVVKRQWKLITNNEQIMTYLTFLVFATGLLSVYRWFHLQAQAQDFYPILRSTLFQIVSVVTSTGFVSDNYMRWGNFVIVVFLFLMMTGACSGSTSGGIKMFRYTVLIKTIATKLKMLVQPHGVFIARYGDKAITDNVLISVIVYFSLYFLVAMICTLSLSFFGMDLITSLSGSLSAISNIGPALGNVIGPDKTFATLPDTVKWILAVCMLMGRLEFISFIVLFVPYFWRKNI